MPLVFLLALALLIWFLWDRRQGIVAGHKWPGTDHWDLAFIIPLLLIAGVPLTSAHREPNPVALKLEGMTSASGLSVGNDRDRDDLFVPSYSNPKDPQVTSRPFVTVDPQGTVSLAAQAAGADAGMDIVITRDDGSECQLTPDNRCLGSDTNGRHTFRLTAKPVRIGLIRTEVLEAGETCSGSGGLRQLRQRILDWLSPSRMIIRTGCDSARKLRLTERRSFTLARQDNGSVKLVLDTPDGADGGTCQSPRNILQGAPNGASADSPIDPTAFHFANLGSRIILSQLLPDCSTDTGRIEAGGKRLDSDTKITVHILRTSAAVDWAGICLFISIIFFSMVVARAVPNRPRFLAIAEPVLLSLLAVRMLAAMAASYLSPGFWMIPSTSELMADTVLTTFIIRFALWPELRRDAIMTASHFLFGGTVLFVAAQVDQSIDREWLMLLMKVAVIVAVWAVCWIGDLASDPRAPSWMSASIRRTVEFIAAAAPVLTIIAAVILFALWFITKERVFGGSTATLSMGLAIIGGGRLLACPQGCWQVTTIAVFVVLVLTAPVMGQDTGFVLVAAGPILAGLATGWLRQRRAQASASWRVAAAALAVVPLAVVTLYAMYLSLLVPVGEQATLPARVAVMSEIGENQARLIGYVNPQGLETVGNRAAFTQLEQQALLYQIMQDNLFGHGYLQPANLGNLSDFQLSDNFAAVHIHWPFGRLALVLLLAVTVMLVLVTRPPPLAADAAIAARWIDGSSTIAAWLLPGISIYMVLANLGLAPFTGRNLVLLSPGSTSDLVDAVILYLAIGLGARSVRA